MKVSTGKEAKENIQIESKADQIERKEGREEGSGEVLDNQLEHKTGIYVGKQVKERGKPWETRVRGSMTLNGGREAKWLR